jgi:hypothetical protein
VKADRFLTWLNEVITRITIFTLFFGRRGKDHFKQNLVFGTPSNYPGIDQNQSGEVLYCYWKSRNPDYLLPEHLDHLWLEFFRRKPSAICLLREDDCLNSKLSF